MTAINEVGVGNVVALGQGLDVAVETACDSGQRVALLHGVALRMIGAQGDLVRGGHQRDQQRTKKNRNFSFFLSRCFELY